MIEFLDRTSTISGTPINRANLMAIQGFLAKTVEFVDGKIIETRTSDNVFEQLTTEFVGNTIIETFKGVKTIVKTTTFNEDGTITEVLS